jgi:hypothetical protein
MRYLNNIVPRSAYVKPIENGVKVEFYNYNRPDSVLNLCGNKAEVIDHLKELFNGGDYAIQFLGPSINSPNKEYAKTCTGLCKSQ